MNYIVQKCLCFITVVLCFVYAFVALAEPRSCESLFKTSSIVWKEERQIFENRRGSTKFQIPKIEGTFSMLKVELENSLQKFNDNLESDKVQRAKALLREINQLKRDGYPYRKSILTIFEIQHLRWSTKGLDTYFTDKADLEKAISLSIQHDFVLMPTYRPLSINDINEMMTYGFLPLGLLDKPVTKVDGVTYNFYHFFIHDMNHALSYLKNQSSRFNYNEWESIRTFLRDSEKLDAITRYSNNILVFVLFHEMSFSFQFITQNGFLNYNDPNSDRPTVWDRFKYSMQVDEGRVGRLKKSHFLQSAKLLNRYLGIK